MRTQLTGRRLRPLLGLLALCVLVTSATAPRARAQNVHGLINFEFSDHYITPRGLDTENQGLVFQPLLLLFWDLYSDKTSAINDVSLTTGVWNDWDSHQSGATPGNWNEIDPILGLTFKIEKQWQLDVFYTEFHSQTDSYPPSTNLDFKLTYHDAGISDLTINPFVEYFDEVHEKATVALVPATAYKSGYVCVGVDPTFSNVGPWKIELPTSMNLVGSHMYQQFSGAGGGSGFAVFTTEVKGTIPLSFMPASYGHWSAYIGEQYYYLDNKGLLDGNLALGATSKRSTSLFQFHTGVTVFF
jgi:hypothetical protein